MDKRESREVLEASVPLTRSEPPMIRLDRADTQAVKPLMKLLFDRGRTVVRDDSWLVEGSTVAEEIARIREMNRTFLARTESQPTEFRVSRWAPGKMKPLLFVEAVWLDKQRNLPQFAVDAVVEESNTPAILWFNYKKAEWTRMGEFADRDWKLQEDCAAFLNAWTIGGASYVLTCIAGFEGYSVDLQRVDAVSGLSPVLGFGQ